jgi:hypothetical protein
MDLAIRPIVSGGIRLGESNHLVALFLSGCAISDFEPYSGQQQTRPTSPGTFVNTTYVAPTYFGYPPRPYNVIGYLGHHHCSNTASRRCTISSTPCQGTRCGCHYRAEPWDRICLARLAPAAHLFPANSMGVASTRRPPEPDFPGLWFSVRRQS